MNSEDSPAVLVARYLRANHYGETLKTFLNEAQLPLDAGAISKNALTIEQVLQEKKTFDMSQRFERTHLNEGAKGWSLPAPSEATVVQSVREASNILHVEVDVLREIDSNNAQKVIRVSTADRKMALLSTHPPFNLRETQFSALEAPVLHSKTLFGRIAIVASMAGSVTVRDFITGEVLEERRDHKKYVVRIALWHDQSDIWVATAGWDNRVFLYHSSADHIEDFQLGNPKATLDVSTLPEEIIFVGHPELREPVLVLGRRDSTFLYYYGIRELGSRNVSTDHEDFDGPKDHTLDLLGRQNLAPHSNAWVAFTPSAFALSPTDPELLAVATSAIPHMKLIIVRLLLPPPTKRTAQTESLTQASQARAELVVQDKEDAAILVNCTTLAPQTTYSTPALAWRPDGSGVWVNGDDGVVRGIESTTGKIVVTLKGGHDAGSKVRCLWAGYSDTEGSQEVVISGGFDRRLIVWRTSA